MKEIFSFNLITLRGEKTQKEIADKAGIELRHYQRLEAGAVPRKRHYLTALAKAHRVEETRLFLDPSAIPERTPPTPAEALKVLSDLLAKVDPGILAALATTDDAKLRQIESILSGNADSDRVAMDLTQQKDDIDNSGKKRPSE